MVRRVYKPWSDEWVEYYCMEHPVGRVLFIIVSVLAVWTLCVLIMCL